MKSIFKLGFLVILGLLSLAYIFRGVSTTKLYSQGGSLEASSFDLSMLDGSGQLLFSISPLNDYYYNDALRDHLINTLDNSRGASVFDEAILSFERLFLRKERLIWVTSGKNIRGDAAVRFEIEAKGRKIEVNREIKNKGQISSVGLVINFCQSCLIADEAKKLYFNGELLTDEKVVLAEKLGFTPVVLGENQSFPKDVGSILFLNREGVVLFKIPVSGSDVFLQEQWHLIEFKKNTESLRVKQEIYIENL